MNTPKPISWRQMRKMVRSPEFFRRNGIPLAPSNEEDLLATLETGSSIGEVEARLCQIAHGHAPWTALHREHKKLAFLDCGAMLEGAELLNTPPDHVNVERVGEIIRLTNLVALLPHLVNPRGGRRIFSDDEIAELVFSRVAHHNIDKIEAAIKALQNQPTVEKTLSAARQLHEARLVKGELSAQEILLPKRLLLEKIYLWIDWRKSPHQDFAREMVRRIDVLRQGAKRVGREHFNMH